MSRNVGSYRSYLLHEKVFNIVFSVFCTSVLVVAFCWYLLVVWQIAITWEILGTWFLVFSLPLLTFLIMLLDPDCKVAYYRTWGDYLAGKIDQNRVLEDANRFWTENTDEVYLITTSYAQSLERRRNILLSLMHQEYCDALSQKHNAWLEAQRQLAQAKIELNFVEAIKKQKQKLCAEAKTASEIYAQRQSIAENNLCLKKSEQKIAEKQSLLERSEIEEKNLSQQYYEQVRQIVKIYEVRYAHYKDVMLKRVALTDDARYEIMEFGDIDECDFGLKKEDVVV